MQMKIMGIRFVLFDLLQAIQAYTLYGCMYLSSQVRYSANLIVISTNLFKTHKKTDRSKVNVNLFTEEIVNFHQETKVLGQLLNKHNNVNTVYMYYTLVNIGNNDIKSSIELQVKRGSA